MITHTGGTWDRNAWPVYFVAANLDCLEICSGYGIHTLVAVNELKGEEDIERVVSLAKTNRVMVDSGVFWLSTQHARAHGLTMNKALQLAPTEVDGFDGLFKAYVELVGRLGNNVWGYVEIDQGGRENKIKTRAKLEAMGLRPIPVYHPFNDGWDYFDYLAERYDRICFGNVVMADINARRRLVATAWERRRKYPHLWIHMLGLTPSDTTTAFPMNSCDSSTWISGVRWGQLHATLGAQKMSVLQDGFIYDRTSPIHSETGHRKAWRMGGYDAAITNRTMANLFADAQNELGCDPGMFDHDRPDAG